MTERKPPDLSVESWIDRQVREAAERGEFDDLPGAGKPLPPTDARDELWWVRQKMQREGLSTEALLPTPLQLRKEIDRLPETVRELSCEHAVREVASQLNRRIAEWLRAPSGPRVPIAPVKVDRVVQQWRADRRSVAPGVARERPDVVRPGQAEPRRRPRRWRRLGWRRRTSPE